MSDCVQQVAFWACCCDGLGMNVCGWLHAPGVNTFVALLKQYTPDDSRPTGMIMSYINTTAGA